MTIRVKNPVVKFGQKNPGSATSENANERRKRGRPRGRNKVTKTVKDNILWVFEQMGGKREFLEWAQKNKDVYYEKVLMKIVPIENLVQGALSVEHAHAVTVTHLDGRIQDLLTSVRTVEQEALPEPEGEVIEAEVEEVAIAPES